MPGCNGRGPRGEGPRTGRGRGRCRAPEILTPPVGRKLAETVRQVQAFQVVRESQGKEATPVGWEPGQPTLKPGPDLVGRVWEVWSPSLEET